MNKLETAEFKARASLADFRAETWTCREMEAKTLTCELSQKETQDKFGRNALQAQGPGSHWAGRATEHPPLRFSLTALAVPGSV